MNFSQVTDITIPEGDVIKIMEGATVLWEKSGWPSGYVKVEYLEGTGTQYIDTGVASSNKTRLKTHFYAGNLGTDSFAVLGSRDSDPYNNTYAIYYIGSKSVSSGRVRADFNITTVVGSIYRFPNTSDMTEYELDYNGNVVTLNNYSHTFTDQTFTSTNNIYLFTVNNSGTTVRPDPRIMLGKFYYCQIYNDGTLVADLQPCVRLSDGKPGMYDLVRRQFFTNQGTGEFAVGPSLLPNEYQEVEYLESTGTQYIDTGLTPTNNTGAYIDAKYMAANNGVITGSLILDQGRFIPYQLTASSGYRSFVGAGSTDTITLLSDSTNLNRHTLEFNISSRDVKFDGVSKGTVGTIGSNNVSLYIFARHYSNSADLKANAKLYSLKLYESGTLTRDFVPCYRVSDNKPGMYDLANGVFYTNAGTGEFTVGPVVT